ncbi:MAG: hypothetical protein ACRENI_13850 [Gemmatimonadaceae bacterium]
MTELKERDAMLCRFCGREERASEGYPCVDCQTFICLMCYLRGVTRCRECEAKRGGGGPVEPAAGESAS